MVIATSCELLAEEPSLGPRARGQLERMTKATEEMRDLVQTFLLLARAQKGEESLAPHGSLRASPTTWSRSGANRSRRED